MSRVGASPGAGWTFVAHPGEREGRRGRPAQPDAVGAVAGDTAHHRTTATSPGGPLDAVGFTALPGPAQPSAGSAVVEDTAHHRTTATSPGGPLDAVGFTALP
ncbi:hypothetical protein, partial [Streptomyces broussonetiae]